MLWSLVPYSVAMPYFLSWTVSLSRVAVNHASQNWPRDRRGFWSARKTSHFQAARGSWGEGSRAVCVATMVSPFGMCTRFLTFSTENLLSHAQVAGSKRIVHPELDNARSKGGDNSV